MGMYCFRTSEIWFKIHSDSRTMDRQIGRSIATTSQFHSSSTYLMRFEKQNQKEDIQWHCFIRILLVMNYTVWRVDCSTTSRCSCSVSSCWTSISSSSWHFQNWQQRICFSQSSQWFFVCFSTIRCHERRTEGNHLQEISINHSLQQSFNHCWVIQTIKSHLSFNLLFHWRIDTLEFENT